MKIKGILRYVKDNSSRLCATQFYSQPIRFAGISAGTFAGIKSEHHRPLRAVATTPSRRPDLLQQAALAVPQIGRERPLYSFVSTKALLCRSGHADDGVGVGDLAVFQDDPIEHNPGGQIGGFQGVGAGDDEIVGGAGLGRQRGTIGRAADDPFGGLTHHPALRIQHRAHGAGRFHALRQMVRQRQRHNDSLPGDFHRRNRDGKLGLGGQGAGQKQRQKLERVHLTIIGTIAKFVWLQKSYKPTPYSLRAIWLNWFARSFRSKRAITTASESINSAHPSLASAAVCSNLLIAN